MVSSVAAGVAPVLIGELAQPFAALATTAAETPGELKKAAIDLAVHDVVAPFLDAGSTKLGDAVGDALVNWVGGDSQEAPTTPSERAIEQVRIELQSNLKAKLAAMPAVQAIAKKTGLTTDQLVTELAQAIAQHLASDLAHGLVRVKSPARLNNALAPTVVTGVTQQQWSQHPPPPSPASPHHPPPPPPAGPYTVKPGDSLWRVSQRLLGPNATTREINQGWRIIYRDNHVTIGTNPNRIAPGQKLRIPHPLKPGLSRELVLLPWLVVLPGILTGIAVRRRRRANRTASQRPATQADARPHATPSAEDDDSRLI
jgi:Tfp pilus assembly protein FimV